MIRADIYSTIRYLLFIRKNSSATKILIPKNYTIRPNKNDTELCHLTLFLVLHVNAYKFLIL